jgi:hypothetical protein
MDSFAGNIVCGVCGLVQSEKTFPPGGVSFYPETGGGVIVVMNKIRITPEGVDGSGPLYERVREIAEDWLKDRGLI